MSSLKDRLRRLKGSPGAAADRPAGEAAPASGAFPEAGPGTDAFAGEEWERLGVRLAASGGGTFLKRRIEYALDYRHGLYAFGELEARASELAALGAGEAAARRMLFLDTETTGLGVGAGNVPFMIGLGFYEEQAFVVEQLFIRHPGEEAAMLDYLRGRLAAYPMMVSYNGKTFDWPVVRNRYVMNRLNAPDAEPQQLDLLYVSRSLWKNTLESCRLSRVEEDRLGIRREEDVPGSLAPALYFQYLAEDAPEVLRGVFAHNERDVMTLAVLAVHVARAACGELAVERMPAEEAYRLALWLQRIGREPLALLAMDRLQARGAAALSRHLPPMAAFYKKLGRMDDAVALWQAAVELDDGAGPGTGALEPYIELAMHYEHGRRDPAAALAYAGTALDRLLRRKSLTRRPSAQLKAAEAALRHRIERLERKCGRIRTAGQPADRRRASTAAAEGVPPERSRADGRERRSAAEAPKPGRSRAAGAAESAGKMPRPASGHGERADWEQASFSL